MVTWNRREFLVAMSATGISAAYTNPWAASPKIRAGIAGWNERSRNAVAVFREMRELKIAAVAAVSPRSVSSLPDWRTHFPDQSPQVYPSIAAMLEQCDLDFVYVDATSHPLVEMPAHLLLEDPEPRHLTALSSPGIFAQVLPKYEFGGFTRSTLALSENWDHAIIDCRCVLPHTPFQNRSEFALWLCREVGEAIDFVCELMGVTQARQVFAAATPAGSPYEAKFGWRFIGSGPNPDRIDLSVVATHSLQRPSGITVTLANSDRSVMVRSAPRSPRLTRLLTWNLLDAVRSGNPQTLVYYPASLKRSHDLVSYAAMSV